MNYKDLNKDERIKSTVKYFVDKFGQDGFKIKDHWDGALNAIGLADNNEKYLVYFSSYDDNDFYVSLENLVSVDDFPYEPAGEFDNVDLKELERIIIEHLRIKTTDAQQCI
jgi:hypothetical protein